MPLAVHINDFRGVRARYVKPELLHISGETHRLKVKWQKRTGGRLNKKDGLTRYGNSHVKDKTS